MLLSLLFTNTALLGAKGGPPVTLAFQDAPVSVVLQALADYQQLNLVVAAGVSGNISLRLVD
ncbi:DNA uptake porin HofQ, partial [Yersinia enterocolitica]|nr:DNA uptake porin HofQ [Yersinia enterocolitica]